MREWFVEINDEEAGPFSEAEVRDLIAEGKLTGESLVWCSEYEDWDLLANSDLARSPLQEATHEESEGRPNLAPLSEVGVSRPNLIEENAPFADIDHDATAISGTFGTSRPSVAPVRPKEPSPAMGKTTAFDDCKNHSAGSSLALTIFLLLFCWLPVVNFILGFSALFSGIAGLERARQIRRYQVSQGNHFGHTGYSLALIGVVFSSIFLVMALIVLLIWMMF